MILKRIEVIEREINNAEKEKTALEGRINLLLEQLEKEFKTRDLNEAKFLLNNMEDEIKGKEAAFKEEFARLEADVKPFIGGK